MTEKKTKTVSNEDLAQMIVKGFAGQDEKFAVLEQGQEDIKLRLDNVAYRFELKELEVKSKSFGR